MPAQLTIHTISCRWLSTWQPHPHAQYANMDAVQPSCPGQQRTSLTSYQTYPWQNRRVLNIILRTMKCIQNNLENNKDMVLHSRRGCRESIVLASRKVLIWQRAVTKCVRGIHLRHVCLLGSSWNEFDKKYRKWAQILYIESFCIFLLFKKLDNKEENEWAGTRLLHVCTYVRTCIYLHVQCIIVHVCIYMYARSLHVLVKESEKKNST